jgi:hypothetical protein
MANEVHPLREEPITTVFPILSLFMGYVEESSDEEEVEPLITSQPATLNHPEN